MTVNSITNLSSALSNSKVATDVQMAGMKRALDQVEKLGDDLEKMISESTVDIKI